MGMLLRFSPKIMRPLPPSAGSGPAEIILFTGVRYERSAVANSSKPARKLKRTRKG